MRDLKRMGVLLVMLSVGGLIGCGEEEECDNGTPACNTSIVTCCSTTQCHYEVKGRTFNCIGLSNCDSAATQAVNAACGAAAPDTLARALMDAAAARVATQRGF